ncbi:MAG: translocation/assembly module TamB domain-containing protein, partial [Bdellovibrionales bacterium]|nr:translocation/assembly module TamB domain-containing protein [Bdellovibrionales bacterium]
FDRARGVVANGTLETSGQVRFVDFGNIPIDLSANVRNANIEFPKNISTSGNALVKISGNWFPYKLEIDYDVRKGVFAREFSEEESSIRTVRPSSFLPKFLDNDNFQTFNLDVAINMAKPLLVKNSQADAQFTGQLKIVGTPENPLFSGRVNTVQEGSLVFRSNEFEIVNASINYDSSPVENPKLYITAQTQISSDDLTYEIKLLIQGTANKPEISMTSLPPLQEYEIVSLLAIGMTSEQADENVGTKELAEQTSYQLGSALLASPLGKQIKNRFGFDFQISSEFDEDNEVIPKVTIKRQITKKLDATATRTLEQNPRNNVKVKYKFNNNLSVIGSWDGNEATSEDQNSSGNSSILGLDLEYKFKFR